MNEMYIFCDLVVCVQIKRQARTDQKTGTYTCLQRYMLGVFYFLKIIYIITLLFSYCGIIMTYFILAVTSGS